MAADAKKKKKGSKKKEEGGGGGGDPVEAPKKKKGGGGAPGWVTTFADLMSLLMCFFVMLVSSASVERTTFATMAKSMKEELGGGKAEEVSEEKMTTVEMKDPTSLEAKNKPATKLNQDLVKEIQDGRLEVEDDGENITIQLMGSATFAAGSVKLKRGFKSVAKKLCDTLVHSEGMITVVGHTDNKPIKTRKYRSNWELAASRSMSVIEALIADGRIPRERFAIRSYGDTRPRVKNDTKEKRAKNRRISVVFAKGEVPVDTLNNDESDTMLINSENVENVGEDQILDFLNKDEPGYEGSSKKGKKKKKKRKKKKKSKKPSKGLGDMGIE